MELIYIVAYLTQGRNYTLQWTLSSMRFNAFPGSSQRVVTPLCQPSDDMMGENLNEHILIHSLSQDRQGLLPGVSPSV